MRKYNQISLYVQAVKPLSKIPVMSVTSLSVKAGKSVHTAKRSKRKTRKIKTRNLKRRKKKRLINSVFL
jgi:hypothetical protein